MGHAAIGRGDLLRHRLARQLGERVGGGDLHLLVDPRRPDIERAVFYPEDDRYLIDRDEHVTHYEVVNRTES